MTDLNQRLFARTAPLRARRVTLMLVALLGLVLFGGTWATYAELDEQVRAPGTVIASSRSQVVQVVDGGVLRNLAVREGDTVQAGDLLAELDTVRFAANAQEIQSKVISLRAAIERLTAELEGRPLSFSPEVAAYTDIVRSQRNLYERRLELQREEQAALRSALNLANQELESIETLEATGDAPRSEVIRVRRQVVELQGEIVNKRNGYRQEAQTELSRNRSELEQAEQVLTQRQEALDATRIRAPMTGTVKNVRITTLGAVLRSGDELLQIVPSDDPLIVEAKVSPKDVGFLRYDLRANVKLDAYDSTVYGSLTGRVIYISPDTIEEEDLGRDEEPYYRVHIQITDIPDRAENDIDIIPGLTASVEIITGNRTVAQYLLKPIRRASADALVER